MNPTRLPRVARPARFPRGDVPTQRNATSTHDADFLFDQAAARLNNQAHDPRRASRRSVMRAAGVIVQPRSALSLKSFLPFAEQARLRSTFSRMT